MPEVIKTVIFTSVAVVLLAAAWVTWPRVAPPTVDDTINKPLFDEFETADAKRLEILRYDTNAENLEEFSVKQTEYGWVIPSKENYQADATDHSQKGQRHHLETAGGRRPLVSKGLQDDLQAR